MIKYLDENKIILHDYTDIYQVLSTPSSDTLTFIDKVSTNSRLFTIAKEKQGEEMCIFIDEDQIENIKGIIEDYIIPITDINNSTLDFYLDVSKKVSKLGYKGIYVVFDEFSKYLEANLDNNYSEDLKFLQDFAEASNRSKKNQLHGV